jgi:hypothetical protein
VESGDSPFTYTVTVSDNQVRPDPNDGQRIRFVLADGDDNPFTYKVTVSQTGTITDSKLTVDRVEYPRRGASLASSRRTRSSTP